MLMLVSEDWSVAGNVNPAIKDGKLKGRTISLIFGRGLMPAGHNPIVKARRMFGLVANNRAILESVEGFKVNGFFWQNVI